MKQEEFEKMSESYRRAVMGYAYTCCQDYDLAEDIVQETLLIAFQKRDHYFPEANFGSWLISIARNVWLRECDRRRISKRAMGVIEENSSILFSHDNYSEDRWAEERTVLKRCLSKLGSIERDIIKSYFKKNLRYNDIANKMKQTISWVKVRMFRARKALLKCVSIALQKG